MLSIAGTVPGEDPKPAVVEMAPSPLADRPFIPFDGGVDPATLSRDDLNKDVVITATVVKFEPSGGERIPHRLTLVDKEGATFEIVYWPDVAERIHGNATDMPFVGQKISARGKLGEYQDKLQLRISNPRTIRMQGMRDADQPVPTSVTPTITSTAPGALTVDQALEMQPSREEIVVEGTVSKYRESWGEKAPNVLVISGGDNVIDAVFYPNNGPAANPELLKEGAKIRVRGERAEYKGSAQLRLTHGGMIEDASTPMVAAASTTTTSAPINPDRIVNSADIDMGHVGHTITVAGKVEGLVPASEGKYAVVRDRDGVIVVYLTLKLGEDTTVAERLANGRQVKIKGSVEYSQMRSQLVVIPADADGVIAPKSASASE